MEPNREFIETEAFDREYGLGDLLPEPLVTSLLQELKGDLAAAIVFADGREYFGKLLSQGLVMYQLSLLDHQSVDPVLYSGPSVRGGLFHLTHELETMGFLALETQADYLSDRDLDCFGRFAAQALERIMHLSCQHRMTAGLHGQVVADSHQRLKKKASQLARSEAKYRQLAQNLEVEVVRKTQAIRDTQVRMLQQEKMASIGQLAAGMAHEINNPVGFVISNLNTLRANANDMVALIEQYQQLADLVSAADTGSEAGKRIDEQLSAIETMRDLIDIDFVIDDTNNLVDESLEGANRVQHIVQSLRDFTHPSVDSEESVDINRCLDTTLSVLSSQLPEAVSLKRDYGALPPVKCHLREVNQVFFNIIKNAVQAVKDNGEIIIRTRAQGHDVRIHISDSGQGMAVETVNQVFDPFFTTREVGSGAGLGLTQAYNTVSSHGGHIHVESVAGSGSTFTVVLPFDGGQISPSVTDDNV